MKNSSSITEADGIGPCLLWTVREAAKALGVCEKTLWTMTKNGETPSVRIGKRGVRYALDDIKQFMAQKIEKSA